MFFACVWLNSLKTQKVSLEMEGVVGESEKFYTDAVKYWSEIPATVDGMLGGFAHISQTDIYGSRLFLKKILRERSPPGRTRAIDCGAGIGRIAKHLLSHFFETVDLVEQNPTFLEHAVSYLEPIYKTKIGRFYPVGLQNFEPNENSYDVIWIQWVSGHLTDLDFISFLRKCKPSLRENGRIILKENVTSSQEIETDENDSSVTRSFSILMELFNEAGFIPYHHFKQPNFPRSLYSVYMFALKPVKTASESLHVETNTVDEAVPAITNIHVDIVNDDK